MNLSRRAKVFWGIVGGLVLGAFGSGLWEVAFKPVLGGCGRLFLSLVTLGIGSARDSVYANSAKGFRELASTIMLQWALGVAIGISTAACVEGIRLARKMKLLQTATTSEKPSPSLEVEARKHARFSWISFFVIITVGTAAFAQISMIGYANTLTAYAHRSLDICAPYLTDQQEKVFRSEFALVKTRADYLDIVHRLSIIAEAKGKKLPEFSPW
jgi:hypothetical protein